MGFLSTRVRIQPSPSRLGLDSDTCAEKNPSRTQAMYAYKLDIIICVGSYQVIQVKFLWPSCEIGPHVGVSLFCQGVIVSSLRQCCSISLGGHSFSTRMLVV